MIYQNQNRTSVVVLAGMMLLQGALSCQAEQLAYQVYVLENVSNENQ